jgi:digeranylgeranylglycerophospholipid reductase
MSNKYDVIIAGAGPAGLMAARAAGENGLKVALLDRKADIPKIHRSCGGVIGVNHYTFGQSATYHDEQHSFAFPVTGFSLSYAGPYQNIYGYQIYSPGGRKLELGDFAELKKDAMKNRTGVAVSKELLLRGIMENLKKYAVEIYPDTNVTSVRKTPQGVLVEGGGNFFEGSFLIAADGINSRIARNLGLNEDRRFFGTSCDTSWEVEGLNCPDAEGFIFMITPEGLFSMLPAAEKNHYHVYALSYRRDKAPAELIQYLFHKDPTFSSWFKQSKLLHATSCVINVFSPIARPYKDNVLLIGDACWRREISNVGALSCGWMAGQAAAIALNEGNRNERGLRSYLEWYERYFYKPHGAATPSALDFQDYLSPEELDYLAELPGRKLPQTMEFIEMVRLIGRTYAELMSTISDERPGILEKLIKLRENRDADMEQRVRSGFPNFWTM